MNNNCESGSNQCTKSQSVHTTVKEKNLSWKRQLVATKSILWIILAHAVKKTSKLDQIDKNSCRRKNWSVWKMFMAITFADFNWRRNNFPAEPCRELFLAEQFNLFCIIFKVIAAVLCHNRSTGCSNLRTKTLCILNEDALNYFAFKAENDITQTYRQFPMLETCLFYNFLSVCVTKAVYCEK